MAKQHLMGFNQIQQAQQIFENGQLKTGKRRIQDYQSLFQNEIGVNSGQELRERKE
jgi:hypothetical protein